MSAASDRSGSSLAQAAGGEAPSRRSLRGLDWFVFFVADVQTGFGPFVSVYLTAQRWTQVDIGLVLSAAGFVSLIGQMPGGALVDAARSERFVAGLAIAAICVSALTYAALPIFPTVLAGSILHAAASCVLGPAMAAISLGLVGHAAIGQRLGRNARFASIGNGLAAAAMGACGYLLSARAVFIVTVLLLVPALIALRAIAENEIDPERAHGAPPRHVSAKPPTRAGALMNNRPLLIFAGCLLLFHLANSAMLPLVGSVVTMSSARWATVIIAACIVVPQLVVAALSPWVGTRAQIWGRRPLLLIGFAALPIRGLLFAFISNPSILLAVQILDGITAAVFAVMVPLIVADLTRDTGHFNLGQGILGTATGIGASLSATFAGYLTDRFGSPVAFGSLAAIAFVGLTLVWLLMPETRPAEIAQDARATLRDAKDGS
ncbi:MAG TPA: MFS transporter [Xanthobacteraceae bacterium]|jgi:predicted MFS family arabinose efflux permease|nr:MFS transporter [Xanthobacteraceae bacterium]